MKIAVIPARGGSKRIPHKNIRPFCGRPMIAYSIAAAIESRIFDRIIVSTDSEQITDVAIEYGAEVPFARPAELSDDRTPTIPVVRHAIEWLTEQCVAIDYVCCIYATAPFLQAADLRQAFEKLANSPDNDFVFPVTSFPFPIWRGLTVTEDRVQMIWPEHELTRSQDLPDAYHDAGQFYWGTTGAWRRCERIFSAASQALVIPRHRVQDIDTLEDWHRAEAMFQTIPQLTGIHRDDHK